MERHTARRGFTLIELMIVIAIIAIIAAIAIPNLLRARIAANESSAIGSMRSLATAQSLYKDEHGSYAEGLATLGSDASLIDAALTSGKKNDYYFEVSTDNDSGITWSASAGPRECDEHGIWTFYINESGIIRRERCPKRPDAESPVLTAADLHRDPSEGAPSDDGRTERALVAGLTALIPDEYAGSAQAILQSLRSDTLARIVLIHVDTDHDGALSAAEIWEADLLALARRLSRGGKQQEQARHVVSPDDAELEQRIREIKHRLLYAMDPPVAPPTDPVDPAPHTRETDTTAGKSAESGKPDVGSLSVEQLERAKRRLQQMLQPGTRSH